MPDRRAAVYRRHDTTADRRAPQRPAARPSITQPDVPAQVDDVIATGMAKDPDQRYATTVELADAARDAITVPIQRPTPSTLTLPATEQAPPTDGACRQSCHRQPRTPMAASPAPTKPAPPPQPPTTPLRAGGISRRTTLALIAGAIALVAGIVAATILVVYRPWERSDAAPPTVFNHAASGDCLMWPDANPDAASIVKCADDHRFEVAESIDMRTFPGAEYGPNAAPPSPARIQQITQEQCEAAARVILGTKFDPSKFSVSMLWSGDRAWRQSGERRMLCGLEQPGPNNQQHTALQGQGRRHRPVQGLADRYLLGHRLGNQPADRRSRRLRGAARHGGDRHRQPGREVPQMHCPLNRSGTGSSRIPAPR